MVAMQRVTSSALLVLLALTCIADTSAQLMPATRAAALAPAPSAVLATVPEAPPAVFTNVTDAFESANITRPDAFVRRVQAGVSAPDIPTGLVCVINLAGQGLTGPVDATSLDPATQATGLLDASITCTGDDTAILEGGSALAPFIANFTGDGWTFHAQAQLHANCFVTANLHMAPLMQECIVWQAAGRQQGRFTSSKQSMHT